MNGSYTSESLLQSGAYTAMTKQFRRDGCTSLFEPPRSLNLKKLIRNHQRGEPQFATTTHILPSDSRLATSQDSSLERRQRQADVRVRKEVSEVLPLP